MVVLNHNNITLNIELDACYVTETFGDITPFSEKFPDYTSAYNRFIDLKISAERKAEELPSKSQV